ncbi:hypothetical protein ALC53_05204, partial [Atta colombica]
SPLIGIPTSFETENAPFVTPIRKREGEVPQTTEESCQRKKERTSAGRLKVRMKREKKTKSTKKNRDRHYERTQEEIHSQFADEDGNNNNNNGSTWTLEGPSQMFSIDSELSFSSPIFLFPLFPLFHPCFLALIFTILLLCSLLSRL